MATKATTLWLTRESKKKGGWYYVYSGSKPRKPKGGWEDGVDVHPFCGRAWESLCPKAVHLRPGGGPIHIVVQRGRRTK